MLIITRLWINWIGSNNKKKVLKRIMWLNNPLRYLQICEVSFSSVLVCVFFLFNQQLFIFTHKKQTNFICWKSIKKPQYICCVCTICRKRKLCQFQCCFQMWIYLKFCIIISEILLHFWLQFVMCEWSVHRSVGGSSLS